MDDQESDLHGQIKRLQGEIKALRKENEDLADEVFDSQAELKNKLGAYDNILQKISALRTPFLQPPPEILHMIFERTIPPYFIIDSSASLCLNPAWCKVQRQKKSIVEVCRAWYNVGLPFLWEDVVILEVHELRNLLWVLKDSSRKLRGLIKRVEIHCFIPPWYEEHFAQQLQLLLSVSPGISSCLFLSQCSPPANVVSVALGNTTTITSLCLSDGLQMDVLGPLLSLLSPHLVTLSFHTPDKNIESFSELPNCNLHALEELTIWVSRRSSDTLISLSLHRWLDMPLLRRLTLGLGFHRSQDDVPAEALRRFCQEYGLGLHFLQIHTPMLNSNYITTQALLDLCPALEHIVVYEKLFGDLGALNHRKIKWIDVWFNDIEKESERQTRKHLIDERFPRPNFPALKGVRFLQHSYAFPYNLPFLLPPNLVSSSEESLRFTFLDFELRLDFGEVYFASDNWATAVGSKTYSDQIPSSTSSSELGAYEDEASGNESESAWSPGGDESESEFSDGESSPASSVKGSEFYHRDKGWDEELDALETDIPIFD